MFPERLTQPRCLIIEDQALIAMSVEAYLEEVGFDVQAVASIAQAREWLADNTPEFVILDFMLKDGPATELAEELHQRSIPFVVYSGYPRHMGVPSELDDVPWLEKPMKREELLKALVQLSLKKPDIRHS
ncbi:response regulator [Microvirga makkahensis]|uniref:Response regulator n=1 Tax=Microvirga makkahensis TaxID=1128670 RepID=A0A7X3MQ16_9HYPH|nr:response regulator [Microvirga makkahensis]MXQ10948.1 response regulator [Microvirga makkahensis]